MGGWKASGLGTRHGPGGIRKYCQQQAILVSRFHRKNEAAHVPLQGEPHEAAARRDPAPLRAGQALAAAPADLVDQAQQVQRGERLGEEEVGARVAGGGLVLRARGRQHHDRRAARLRLLAQPGARGDAVELGMSTSRKTIAGLVSTATVERLLAVARLVQLEARDVLERRRDQLADERVVVDDQDAARGSRQCSARMQLERLVRHRGERLDDRRVELRAALRG